MTPERENEIRFWLKVIAERDNSEQPTYFCYPKQTDPATAEADYIERFGEEPQEAFVEMQNLCLGPVEATP